MTVPAVIPSTIVGGVTVGHNALHHGELLFWHNNGGFGGVFPVGTPAAGTAVGKDKAAILAAVNAAKGAPKGGVVLFGPGVYDVGDLAITLPKYAGLGKMITFKGAGWLATTLKFSVDRGAGTWAIAGDSLDTDLYFHNFEDIGFSGPGVRAAGLAGIGVAPCAMNGIKVGSRMRFNRCAFGLWRSALWMDGNHIEIRSTECHDNYQAIYFGQQYGLSGDVLIDNCALDGNTFASIGVANYTIATFRMTKGHLGLCPYPVYFDAGSLGQLSMGGTQFDGVSIEQTGNSYFYSPDATAKVFLVDFRQMGNYTRLHGTYGIAATTVNPGIRVAEWRAVTFSGGMPVLTASGVAAGETGPLFDVAPSGYLDFTTDTWKVSYDSSVATGRPWIVGPTSSGRSDVTLTEGNRWVGFAAQPSTASGVTAGQLVEYDLFKDVRPWGHYGGAKGQLAGVTLNTVAASSATHAIVVTKADNVPVLCDGAAPSSFHLVASSATAGKATGIPYDGTNTSTLGRRIIGPSYAGVAIPTGASTVACQVDI